MKMNMNCPKCNKEVSLEWKLCPFCGYEPKKCSNTKHAPRWLPQEAKFCPECGEQLDGVMPTPSPVLKESKVSVGDILCTDETTVRVTDWPMAGKTAMGVVFYVDDTGQHGWAVHLCDQGRFLWTPNGKVREVYGLKKCESKVVALEDKDGYVNTLELHAAGNAYVYPAAYAVDFERGWYLPALGQLKDLFNRKKTINVILKKIDGEILLDDCYWSSTQESMLFAWRVGYGNVHNVLKTSNYRVRSVRTF